MLGLATGVTNTSYQWQPTFVGTLKIWLRNGVGVTVGQWDDSSGNANHATQGTSGDQAALAEGGLDFEAGEGDHYDFDSQVEISAEEGFSIFVVCNLENTASGNMTLLGLNAATHFLEFQAGADNMRLRLGSTTTTISPGDGSNNDFAVGSKMLVTIQREAGGTGNINLYKNGVILAQDSQAANPGDGEFISLGVRNNDRFLDGIVHEILMVEGDQDKTEVRNKIHDYLLSKHGVS